MYRFKSFWVLILNMEEIITYMVLGKEVNKCVGHLRNRNVILIANDIHFSNALSNYKTLTPEIDGFEEEKERAETIYKTITANPGHPEIEKFELDGKKLMYLKLKEYSIEELKTISNFIEDYEENYEGVKSFFLR